MVRRKAPCCHPPCFLIFTCKKNMTMEMIQSQRKEMDYVSLIGAYDFKGIEPQAQIPKYAILSKVLNNNA